MLLKEMVPKLQPSTFLYIGLVSELFDTTSYNTEKYMILVLKDEMELLCSHTSVLMQITLVF